uniref:Uncharacterized protein n=1 Tax=Arundo donax TaxID=35708 RepID=A0A0A9FP83_ARUDO
MRKYSDDRTECSDASVWGFIKTYCLVVVMERSQSLRQTEWKALLQLGFSHV